MSPDVLRHHVLALHVPEQPLTADELDMVEWLAKSKRAVLMNLPAPKRPGLWEKVKALAMRVYSAWLDRRALMKAISAQEMRICVLEDFIEENRLSVPGGRSDE